jgi:hypothetical protein
VPQAGRQGRGVGVEQACAGAAVLAPADEDLAEASVLTLVGGQAQPFGADGYGDGMPGAPHTTDRHHLLSELVYELLMIRA